MAGESIAEKLISATKVDLVSYEELLVLSGREYAMLSAAGLDALPVIIEEKERLIRKIGESSDHNARLWTEFEESS